MPSGRGLASSVPETKTPRRKRTRRSSRAS